MAIWDSWINKVANNIAARVVDLTAVQPIVQARAYRTGQHRPQLRVKAGQYDDNIGINFAGLIVARVVGQMLGRGVELDFEGETETAQEQYIKAVLDANKQEMLFQRAALSAAEAGTGYLLIIPNGVVGEDTSYPRLQLLDPTFLQMDTLPEDYEVVIRYRIEYKFTGADGREKARRRVIEQNAGNGTWSIFDYEQASGGRYELVNTTAWPYDFPPILHWQNLPSVASCYGEPDITDSTIALNDRLNLLASNISKIVRLYAHPMRYGVNIGPAQAVDIGPDQMLRISGDGASIQQLEALGDLASSLEFFRLLRQALFDNSRTVDIDSLQDKLGTLTNFGLRVLYQDNSTMIAAHRELFGDMLEELARRLLILNGMQPVPCTVVWPDFLPVNESEKTAALEADLRMEIISHQTAAGLRGYDWEQEQERMESEKASNDNIGAALLRSFTQGGGGALNG